MEWHFVKTVGELRQKISEVPDDTPVVMVDPNTDNRLILEARLQDGALEVSGNYLVETE